MDGPPIDPRDYVRRLLEAYRATPGTAGAVHRADTNAAYRWKRSRTRSFWLRRGE